MKKWEARPVGQDGAFNIYEEGARPSDGKIAYLPPKTWINRDKDARLIASAPEMLETLEMLAEALKEGNYDENHAVVMFDTIKKAKGD